MAPNCSLNASFLRPHGIICRQGTSTLLNRVTSHLTLLTLDERQDVGFGDVEFGKSAVYGIERR